MEEMTLKQSLHKYEHEGNSDLTRATSLEGELICLQKMIKHQQEMSVTIERMLSSLVEQQKLSVKEEETRHLHQQQEIIKLKAQITGLEKNQTLLKEKCQLIEVRHWFGFGIHSIID